MYDHILIPTDGSELAHHGVEQGLSLAKALGSKVTIIIVTEPFPIRATATAAGWAASPDDFATYEAGQKTFADGILATAKAEAAKAGIDADTLHVPDAWAASTIVETAQRLGSGLIVMASHGRRGFKRLLLGSQTAEVLATATIPVLVVR